MADTTTIEAVKRDLLDQITVSADPEMFASAYKILAEAQSVEANTEHLRLLIERDKV